MKTISITVVVILIMFAVAYYVPRTTEFEAVETEVIEKEVTPEWATDEEAVQAAKDVIRRKELEAEEARLVGEIKGKQSELDEIRKELGSYWTVKANILQEIRKTFTQDPVVAVAVAQAESKLNPRAYNPEWHYDRQGNKVCQGSYGIMQVACVHYMQNPEALFDVEFNLAMARKIYNESRWQPWGAHSDGRYLAYMR